MKDSLGFMSPAAAVLRFALPRLCILANSGILSFRDGGAEMDTESWKEDLILEFKPFNWVFNV